jgi:lipopolysaccharide transport system permease protein
MVRYRDVQYALPFSLQIWMYLTPVIYPASLIPDRFRWLLNLNPVTGIVEGFRWSLFGNGAPSLTPLFVGTASSLALFVGGLFFFRRTERTIVDMI